MTKKTKKIPVAAGVCPKCGCNELENGMSEIDDELVGYDWDCPKCGAHGTEWHRMEFSSHSIRGKGKYESFDAELEPIVIEVKGGVATCAENPTDNPVVIKDLD